jgi:MFS superfamily sulfate permease-like transporter
VKATAGRPLPITPWLRGYDRAWLVRDLIGGLAAGAVVIPQAMAYATLADLPAQVGLYTCMVPMAVYPLLGGSRTLSVSTTSTVAILTGSTLLAAGVAAGSDDPFRALATLTLLVGVILLIARALRLGVLIDNISEATLTGIKVGVGLTVAAGQLPSLLGIKGDPTADNFVAELRAVIDNLADISWTTVAFSAATLAVLVGLRRAWRRADRAGAVRAPDAGRPLAGPPRAVAARRLRHRHHGVPGDPGRRPRRAPQVRTADRQRPGAPGQRPVVCGGGVPSGHAVGRRLLPDRDQPARGRAHPAQRARHRRPGDRLRPVPRTDPSATSPRRPWAAWSSWPCSG